MLIPSPNGRIPWWKGINAREIFKVPDALINFLAKIRSIYSIPFRSLESILRIFSGIMGLNAIHYTNIFRRIRNIEVMNPVESIEHSMFSELFSVFTTFMFLILLNIFV